MKNRMLLQLFAESDPPSGGDGNGGQARNAGNTTPVTGNYTHEQLEAIASNREERASRAALADFFRKQNMSEDEITNAIADFKKNREASRPDVSKIEKERDAATQELRQYKNEKTLLNKQVREEDLDYVMFKVNALVDEKTDFSHAAEKFLKENPRYAGEKKTYKVTTGTLNGGAAGQNQNEQINDAIRNALKRR